MLKVGSPQPPMDNAMPSMGDPNMMSGGIPPMDDPNDGIPPMNSPNMMGNNSEFDTNFDAQVDADENTDPKKYIQQLTGKLSQSLRKYNSGLPQPDEELSKYVAGMILKQSTEGLTDGDKKEIIDKVNDNESDNEMIDSGNSVEQMPPMDVQNDFGGDMQQPMMESINHRKIVNEIFQELINKKDDNTKEIAQRPIKNIGFRKKPFTAPNMH